MALLSFIFSITDHVLLLILFVQRQKQYRCSLNATLRWAEKVDLSCLSHFASAIISLTHPYDNIAIIEIIKLDFFLVRLHKFLAFQITS